MADVVIVEGEYCPRAITDYYSFGFDEKKRDCKIKDMQLKAKKHLSAVGWSFYHITKLRGTRELRYRSPSGKLYFSLRTACKGCIDGGGRLFDLKQNLNVCGEVIKTQKKKKNLVLRDVDGLSPKKSWGLKKSRGKFVGSGYFPKKRGNDLLHNDEDDDFSQLVKGKKSRDLTKSRGNLNGSEPKENKNLIEEVQGINKIEKKRKNGVLQDQDDFSPMLKKEKKAGDLNKLKKNVNGNISTHEAQSRKTAQEVTVPSSFHYRPKTVLSWLIDNNVVLPSAKVHYCDTKDGSIMAEGRITRDGIRCSCCEDVLLLGKLEVHNGSTNHRPAANIFLEDGRSLLECQKQLKRDNNLGIFRAETGEVQGSRHHSATDDICSVCHDGGELVLCDQCPSTFHKNCLGLEEVPDGDWFCPSCCCKICAQTCRFNKDRTVKFTDDSVLICDQCEHRYHAGCLRRKGFANLESFPKGNWFCNKRCEKIFLALQGLLGKPVSVRGGEKLTWTLLKFDIDASDIEDLTETYSKLNVALCVMHECFEPVKEPRTKDVVEDVIFGRCSELKRLDCRGFYTVVLERNDEVISVANVRVYGEKVAEVPLVGTRFKYRRHGMCRILMNELEKKLMELGVETLVLPAIPSMLKTWTTSFGFSVMTETERFNLLDYTFLDFKGTIMCQKLLSMKIKSPSTESGLISRPTQEKLCDEISIGDDIVHLDDNSVG